MRSILSTAIAVAFYGVQQAAAEAQCGVLGPGAAKIVNNCAQEVFVSAVPQQNGDAVQAFTSTIAQGQTFTQEYYGLETGGWSLKTYNAAQYNGVSGDANSPVLQFEYNTDSQNTAGNQVWWDISGVNNNPFAGNFAVGVSNVGQCAGPPKQVAYACSEDDQAAMQPPCRLVADTILYLCVLNQNKMALGPLINGGSGTAMACPDGRNPIGMPSQEGAYASGSGSYSPPAAPVYTPASSSAQAPSSSVYQHPQHTQGSEAEVVNGGQALSSSSSSSSSDAEILDNNVQVAGPTPNHVVVVETHTVTAMVINTVYVRDADRRRHVHGHHKRSI